MPSSALVRFFNALDEMDDLPHFNPKPSSPPSLIQASERPPQPAQPSADEKSSTPRLLVPKSSRAA
jgi:hypothetical protein